MSVVADMRPIKEDHNILRQIYEDLRRTEIKIDFRPFLSGMVMKFYFFK